MVAILIPVTREIVNLPRANVQKPAGNSVGDGLGLQIPA